MAFEVSKKQTGNGSTLSHLSRGTILFSRQSQDWDTCQMSYDMTDIHSGKGDEPLIFSVWPGRTTNHEIPNNFSCKYGANSVSSAYQRRDHMLVLQVYLVCFLLFCQLSFESETEATPPTSSTPYDGISDAALCVFFVSRVR